MEDESKLIKAAADGDDAAFEALVIRYQRDVVRTVRFTVSEAHVVEDLVQESFFRAFKSLRKFDTKRPFRNWLLTITLNVCRSYLRRRKVMQPWSNWLGGPLNSGSESDDRALLYDVLKAMTRLRYKDREILILHYVNDLTIQESADLLGIPVGTAKSRLSKALERLRGLLQHEDLFKTKEVTESGREAHRCSASPGSR